MLRLIKLVHTVIWAVMAAATFYVLYCGLTKTFNLLLWLALGLMTLETIVLIFNKWTCPLTPLAAKYTTEQSENFDSASWRIFTQNNSQIQQTNIRHSLGFRNTAGGLEFGWDLNTILFYY